MTKVELINAILEYDPRWEECKGKLFSKSKKELEKLLRRKEELENQLRKKYYFDEEYPGCSYVESWHKEGNKVFVTFRSWGCD